MIATLVALTLAQTGVKYPNVETNGESPREWITEVRLGSYYPWVDRPASCDPGSCPYFKTFGSAMLLAELEIERELFQQLGTASFGVSFGYAEKYGHATTTDGSVGESTSLKVVPMKALVSYRFDWAANKWGVPLVPYAKFGFQADYWWTSKGTSNPNFSEGVPGNGISFGLTGMFGLALQLDFLDPRLARDFDIGMGVNHTYLFAEYDIAEITDFGRVAADGKTPATLDLSSRTWMFGIAFEY